MRHSKKIKKYHKSQVPHPLVFKPQLNSLNLHHATCTIILRNNGHRKLSTLHCKKFCISSLFSQLLLITRHFYFKKQFRSLRRPTNYKASKMMNASYWWMTFCMHSLPRGKFIAFIFSMLINWKLSEKFEKWVESIFDIWGFICILRIAKKKWNEEKSLLKNILKVASYLSLFSPSFKANFAFTIHHAIYTLTRSLLMLHFFPLER